ncbi:MAG: lamin tail domain-containing protein [Labilithrix sp.]|nr:lamin tail domain-containing protein [Labilithrix sp.]
MRTLIIASASCAWMLACGGSDDGSVRGAQSGAGANAGSGVESEAARAIVFNEVAAVGTSEWIEIANSGELPVDLGDHAVADTDKKTSEPKRSAAMKFPAGTTIAPGARIVIVTSRKTGGVGPHPKADCLPDGPDSCFYARFGISASSGEALHLLAPGGQVLVSTAIPKTLGADAGGNPSETQCRLPDVTGAFATCAPTPGRANHGP